MVMPFLSNFRRKRKLQQKARKELRTGLSFQQVLDVLEQEFSVISSDGEKGLTFLTHVVGKAIGLEALRKERVRRSILFVVLLLLALAEAATVLPLITASGMVELKMQYSIPFLFVLLIYPTIYVLLAGLSLGTSFNLYKWILLIMTIAIIKDLPAATLYFSQERVIFIIILSLKLVSLILTVGIALRLRRAQKELKSLDNSPSSAITETSKNEVNREVID